MQDTIKSHTTANESISSLCNPKLCFLQESGTNQASVTINHLSGRAFALQEVMLPEVEANLPVEKIEQMNIQIYIYIHVLFQKPILFINARFLLAHLPRCFILIHKTTCNLKQDTLWTTLRRFIDMGHYALWCELGKVR